MPSRASSGTVLVLLMCLLAITTAVPVVVHGSPEPALRGRSSFRRGSEGSVDATRYPSPVPPCDRRFDLSHSVGMHFRADAEDSDVEAETSLRFFELRSFGTYAADSSAIERDGRDAISSLLDGADPSDSATGVLAPQ